MTDEETPEHVSGERVEPDLPSGPADDPPDYSSIARWVSAAWVAACLLMVWLDAPADIAALTLNEWGDFLSAFVAGLAFIWLAAGFYQQAAEIRLNTEELRLQRRELEYQREELKNQRKETAALVGQAERQADAARTQAHAADVQTRLMRVRAWPLFRIGPRHSEGGVIVQKIESVGARCFLPEIVDAVGCAVAIRNNPTTLPPDEDFVLVIGKDEEEGPAEFRLACRTEVGDRVTFGFELVDGQLRVAGTPDEPD